MTAPAWMPFYVADYLADTGHLSVAEHGAYVLLIMHYWQHEALPPEPVKLARICRMRLEEWEQIAPTISDLFQDGWRHKRIDAELATAHDTINKRSAAGKAGASARYGKRNAIAETNAVQTNAPLPSPTPEEEKEGSEAKASGVPPVDERVKLFSDGLKAIKRITGQPERNARALIGRWLKVTGDDCLTVGRLIEDAERDQRADPVAWIEAHFKPRPAGGAPPGAKINPDGTFERWAL